MTHPTDRQASEEALLSQMSWIRRLAHRLVVDQELAEDLVQETVVVALERRPNDLTKLRRWLASVMRNALRQYVRGSSRRRTREELTARREAQESTEALVERVSIQRELAEHVLALHEPYRSVVILRFFDELPPREISSRLDVPIATVNSRLQRGLALLRRRLDAAHGSAEEAAANGTRGWMAALMPLVERFEFSTSSALGGLVVKAKAVTAVLCLVAAAGTVAWSRRDAPEFRPLRGGPSVAVAQVLTSTPEDPSSPFVDPSRVEAERRVVPEAARLATSPGAELAGEQPTLRTLRVRVLDGGGAPVPGVPLVSENGDSASKPLGVSGAGGWLELETTSDSESLVVADGRWVTVHTGEWRAGTSYDPVVVIAPAIRLAGRVENSRGEKLPGARVRYALPEDFRTRFADILDATSDRTWVASSSDEGAFVFERVPAIEGAELRAVLAGYEADVQPAPLQPAVGLTLILVQPEVSLAGKLQGRVIDAEGQPVEHARVSLGVESVLCNGAGEFELDLYFAVNSDTISAVKEGYLPARMERPGVPDEDSSGWPDFVVLELPGPALSIRGRLLDHQGRPAANAKVWLADPTPTAPIGLMPTSTESLMAGGVVPPIALESRSQRPKSDGDRFNDWVAGAGPPSAMWYWVLTDGAGNFELGGLQERHYRLSVMPENGLEVQTTDPVRAGADGVVLSLPQPDQFDKVAGVVRTPDGRPVEGASVRLWRPVFDSVSRVFGGTSQVTLTEVGGTTSTDEEGRFVFEDVPREGAHLSIRGDDVVPASVDLTGEQRPRALEVVVDVRCHLQVIAPAAEDPFDAIALEDAEGHPLEVLIIQEDSVSAYTDAALVGGRSGVISVSSRAARLLLLRGGEVAEVKRIDLRPGEINTIEL